MDEARPPLPEQPEPDAPQPTAPQREAPEPAAPQVEGSPTLWSRFPDIVLQPARVMVAIRQRPAWFLPALVLILITMVYTAANLELILPETLQLQLDRSTSGVEVERLQEQIAKFSDPSTVMRVMIGLAAGFSAWIMILIPGFFYHLFLKLSGGTGSAGQTLGVIFWTSLVGVGLKTLLGWLIVLFKGSALHVSTGLALLVPDAPVDSLVFQALSLFGDVFVWWQLVLMIGGFAWVHEMSRQRSVQVTLATFLLTTGSVLVIQRLGQMFSS